MAHAFEAFSLGAAAILTNACVLPLYPGLIAFLTGNSGENRRASGWLGLIVLLGVLTMMLVIGLVVFLLQQTFSALLPIVLPLVYGLVIVFGVLLLLDRSPFARLSMSPSPMMRNRIISAYLYGLLLGPMTLPCTGPIISSAFFLGASDSRLLIDGLIYFLFFGLGFGWPLIMLPWIALPLQRRFVGWLARHNGLLNRASGILLIAVGLFGILTELLPNYLPQIEVDPAWWSVYWVAVVGIIAAVVAISYHASAIDES
ncbi:MAG: cytochrome c biogenesis protein CcdA [Chloroflexota bacterium]